MKTHTCMDMKSCTRSFSFVKSNYEGCKEMKWSYQFQDKKIVQL